MQINQYFFSSSIELPAGSYYLAVEATGGANIAIGYCDFPTADWREGSPMGDGKMTYATCTQPAGTWTTTTTRQAFIGLIVDGIEGGGGGSGSGISQGLHSIGNQIP
jgi:hypothetical protein